MFCWEEIVIERFWCVYIHTNLKNGKRYVGITSQYPQNKRWLNGYGYQKNAHFGAAIQKYGWDGFSHEIIADKLLEADAIKLESELIQQYKSYDALYGYNNNLASVGSGIMSETTKEKISIANGGNNHWTKKHNVSRAELPNSKPAYCVELNKIYPSVIDASLDVGCSKGNIASCCRGERHISGGYHWVYVSDLNSTSIDQLLSYQKKSKKRPVYCHELNRKFPSAQDAAEYFLSIGIKADGKGIHRACREKHRHVGGCSWSYLDELY